MFMYVLKATNSDPSIAHSITTHFDCAYRPTYIRKCGHIGHVILILKMALSARVKLQSADICPHQYNNDHETIAVLKCKCAHITATA